jgi:hypothetical protein
MPDTPDSTVALLRDLTAAIESQANLLGLPPVADGLLHDKPTRDG